jgi:hypothetical protein
MEEVLKTVGGKKTGASSIIESVSSGSNPLTGELSSMVTGQLMAPPTVYYVAGFIFLLVMIIGCIIYLIIKTNKLDDSIKNISKTNSLPVQMPQMQQFQNQIPQQNQQIPQNIQQPQQPIQNQYQQPIQNNAAMNQMPQYSSPSRVLSATGVYWSDGTPMSAKDIKLEEKPLKQRSLSHLIKTLVRVMGDSNALNKFNGQQPVMPNYMVPPMPSQFQQMQPQQFQQYPNVIPFQQQR